MQLERFTWRNALAWINFRMVADVIGKTLNGFFSLANQLLDLGTRLIVFGLLAWAAWWLWETFGAKLPL